jgi:integration host factor subunit alpha
LTNGALEIRKSSYCFSGQWLGKELCFNIILDKEDFKMTITKAKVVDDIISELDYPKKKSVDTLELLLEIVKRTLENGEDVLISGFGKFCVKNKKARRGRNPATGDEMILDGRNVIVFKCSHLLRKKINASNR